MFGGVLGDVCFFEGACLEVFLPYFGRFLGAKLREQYRTTKRIIIFDTPPSAVIRKHGDKKSSTQKA